MCVCVCVGDDGEGDEPTDAHLVKRADHSYVVWSSGRESCDGLLVHLEVCNFSAYNFNFNSFSSQSCKNVMIFILLLLVCSNQAQTLW